LVALTPVPRRGYRIGVPKAGEYRECFNSDSHHYGGSDIGNAGVLTAVDQTWMGRPASLVLTVPPLAGLVLVSG
jgi:1,4-alpha-glucan branching enzyme